MEIQTGEHWSKLLKSATIAMNSTKKRSHGQTAFKVMWGRESRHEDLLSAINNLPSTVEEDFEMEEAILTKVLLPQDEMEQIEDEFSPPLDQPQEEVLMIDDCRAATQKLAVDSINFEQTKQSMQYNKKVNQGW